MRWLKKDLRNVAIALSGMLLLLALMVWLPLTAVDAHERASGLVGPVTIPLQSTPTEDATVTALNKEKLAQEVQQLKNLNEPDSLGWLRTNAAVLLSTLVVVIGGLIGLFRWLGDRRDQQEKRREDQYSEQEKRAEEQKRWLEDRQAERERRAEERFQEVVEGLGSEREEAKVGAAITLRTFLRPGYEQFYTQTFDLAIAHLRLPSGSVPLDGDPDNPLPLTTLSQALTVVFKEAFPLVRERLKGQNPNIQFNPLSLDATGIKLDCAFLVKADLKQVWMPQAFLRKVNLSHANLSSANFDGADLSEAQLVSADLSEANLKDTKLGRALLNNAKLDSANLWGADLSLAILNQADLSLANLRWASLTRTTLTQTTLRLAQLMRADLSGAVLRGTNLEEALSLKGTNLHQVIGLTKAQLEAYNKKYAIIDEGSTASSSQASVSPPSLSQSSDIQAQSAPPAQSSILPPDPGGSNAASSGPSL